MKRLLSFFVISFGFLATFAQWSVSSSGGLFAAMQGKDLGSVNIEISHPVSDLFSFGLVTEYLISIDPDPEQYSNVVFEIKTDIMSMIQSDRILDMYLDTGIGWGHNFTTDMVDHNFNTYRLGLDARLFGRNRQIGGVVKIGTTFRSRNEHMIDRSSGKLYFLVGVCLLL